MKNISATLITLNEEHNLKGVIESVAAICSEVIVVDSHSSDRTVELARALGAKVVVQAYLGDGRQKDYGVRFAENDWILSIDADERLDPGAVQAIAAIDLEHTEFDAFALKRKTFVGNRWIKLWYPDYVVRLYNKHKARYLPVRGHSRVDARHVKRLDADILHYSYRDYADMLSRLNRFSTRGAEMLAEKGRRATRLDPLLHGLMAFVRKFVLKRGMFHGLDGLSVSMLTAVGTYLKYLKLIEIGETKDRLAKREKIAAHVPGTGGQAAARQTGSADPEDKR